jgi:cellulose synthase/poly-beta-1,6-N-acetylglucosamine synthase-like glycosyltransferase
MRVVEVLYVLGMWSLALMGVGGIAGVFRRGGGVAAESGRRVLVMVPAHDEQDNVLATVESLQASGCVVVVVADRCRDETAMRSRRAGAFVFEVDEGNKGLALNRFMDESDLWEGFEYLSCVDCGTTVGVEYGGRVVEALGRASVVQGWLHSAGRLSWVGAWASWQYGMYHLAAMGRRALHVSGWIGGSGFAWHSSLGLRFDARCMTEDLELALRLHAGGCFIAYEDLGVFDEKPATLGAFWTQHIRWARGQWWLVLRGRFVTWRLDDVSVVLAILLQAYFGLLIAVNAVRYPVAMIGMVIVYGILGAAGMVLLHDEDRLRPSLVWSMLLLLALCSVIAIAGLASVGRRRWVRTPHESAASGVE